ncbi:MAG: hypothetical protein II326_00780 [Clostridia bacterium]|nr:hypothetical protein [Clostridia bacterium]
MKRQKTEHGMRNMRTRCLFYDLAERETAPRDCAFGERLTPWQRGRRFRGGFFFPKELPRPALKNGRSASPFAFATPLFWQKDKNKNILILKREEKSRKFPYFY